jgi:hypothetical protein
MNSPGSTFDVQAKAERKVSFGECRLMVQSLLADRFQFASHWETRELPVYVLSVGSKGSELHEADDDPAVLSRVRLNGGEIQVGDGYSMTASGRGMSMRELARFLTRLPTLGRPVIDKTGLEGFYGFSLDFAWTLEDDSRPDIFAALQEQRAEAGIDEGPGRYPGHRSRGEALRKLAPSAARLGAARSTSPALTSSDDSLHLASLRPERPLVGPGTDRSAFRH